VAFPRLGSRRRGLGTAGRLGPAIQLRSGEKMPGQSPGRGLRPFFGGDLEGGFGLRKSSKNLDFTGFLRGLHGAMSK